MIVIHGNSLDHVTDAYKRFLEGRFRKEFDLVGTPLRIELKTSQNPFADKEATDAPGRDEADPELEVRIQARFLRPLAIPAACVACVNVPVFINSSNTENIVSNKGQLLQDPFLNTLRREHVPVSIYLVNGIKLQGQIESFDQYVVLLRNTVTQMVYKHAISTIVPGRAVNFSPPRAATQPPERRAAGRLAGLSSN